MSWPLRGMSAMPRDCHNNLALRYHRTRASALAVSRLMRARRACRHRDPHPRRASQGDRQGRWGGNGGHGRHPDPREICFSVTPPALCWAACNCPVVLLASELTGGETGDVLEHGLLAPMRKGFRLAASGRALRDVENLDTCPILAGQHQCEVGGAARHVRAVDRNQNAGAGF